MIPRLFTYVPGVAVTCVPEAINVTRRAMEETPETCDAALVAGMHCESLSFAFTCGYQAAIRSLAAINNVTDVLPIPSAVCVTEKVRPPHPRSILCGLTRVGGESNNAVHITGEKSFVTCGFEAQSMLVIGRIGDSPQLSAAAVDVKNAAGMRLTALPPMKFCAELNHASVSFDRTPATLLPGDGYRQYMRAFRSVEDAHIAAAMCGCFIRIIRRERVPPELATRIGVLASAVLNVGKEVSHPTFDDVSEHSVNLVLCGIQSELLTYAQDLCSELLRSRVIIGERLERDLPLLRVAQSVRDKRLQSAITSVLEVGKREI